jgi:hypothetical protein
MKRIAKFLFAGIFVASALAGGLYVSGCGKSEKCCNNPTAKSCRCGEDLSCNASETEIAACPAYTHEVVCCDSAGIKLCNCYDGKVCDTGDSKVASCPSYTHCCQDQTDPNNCTCWDYPCSDTANPTNEVSSCPK